MMVLYIKSFFRSSGPPESNSAMIVMGRLKKNT